MKRFSTAFLLLILAAALSTSSFAQTMRSAHGKELLPSLKQVQVPPTLAPTGINDDPQPIYPFANPTITKAVSYFSDTTDDNWWIYTPVFSDPAGSPANASINFGPKLYLVPQDSIGDLTFSDGTNNITVFDTMCLRISALRVSVPSGIKLSTAKVDSVTISLFPIAMDDADSIVVKAVSLTRTTNGEFPFPSIFTPIVGAVGKILPSQLTAGEVNNITIPFKRSLGGRAHFAIIAYVDGPNFINDTIGYVMDANLQEGPANFEIDTDGTIGVVSAKNGDPIEMRSYRMNLDLGNTVSTEGTPYGQIGGGGGFFTSFVHFDETGTFDNQFHFGNFAMTTYISGTSTAGVDDEGLANSLDELYPNPVSSSAAISYVLERNSPVTLKLYNTLGNEVGTFVNSVEGAGRHDVAVDASKLPNGTYYYKLQAGDFTATRMMVVAK